MAATTPGIERSLLRTLRGRVLEIGPGTGDTVGSLRRDLDWIGLEPRADVLEELERTASRRFASATVIEGVAERIPLPDGDVDMVLSSLVLCSVEDQSRALAEVGRVLRPGGRFVFIEHVAAPPRTVLRFAQRLTRGIGRRRPGDCDPVRDTLQAIERAFPHVEVERYRERGAFGIGVPHVAGTAGL